MIVLTGFMGAGKTTVGRRLAERLGLRFVDSDLAIVSERHVSIPELFTDLGEEGFRRLEAEVVAGLLAGPTRVVALGGGAVTTPEVREVLAGHDVVLLEIGYRQALDRLGHDPGRPMLARPDLAAVYAARQPHYRAVASVRVDVGDRTPEEVVDEIVTALAAGPVDRGEAGAPE